MNPSTGPCQLPVSVLRDWMSDALSMQGKIRSWRRKSMAYVRRRTMVCQHPSDAVRRVPSETPCGCSKAPSPLVGPFGLVVRKHGDTRTFPCSEPLFRVEKYVSAQTLVSERS